ncbi:hypothetical protein [Acidithiobacillus ferrivorans]|nr:hypothetical protein [Acidithiobacillus ferrivorans]
MGKFSEQLKEANNDRNWRKIVGKLLIDKHQKDVELLLRIFSLVGADDKYEKPMREFLNNSMKRNESGETKKVKKFFEAFHKVTEEVVSVLGEKPFHLRGPLNVSALDSVMCVLIESSKSLKRSGLKDRYSSLIKDSDFTSSTSINTTDAKTLQQRFAVVRKHLLAKQQ